MTDDAQSCGKSARLFFRFHPLQLLANILYDYHVVKDKKAWVDNTGLHANAAASSTSWGNSSSSFAQISRSSARVSPQVSLLQVLGSRMPTKAKTDVDFFSYTPKFYEYQRKKVANLSDEVIVTSYPNCSTKRVFLFLQNKSWNPRKKCMVSVFWHFHKACNVMFTARFCYLVTRQTLAEVTEAKYVEGFFWKKFFWYFASKVKYINISH